MAEDRVPAPPANKPLPSATLSRELQAHLEVGRTDVTPGTARAIVLIFLVMIAIVPLVEWAGVRTLAAEGADPSWTHLARLPAAIGSRLAELPSGAGAWTRVVTANRQALSALSAFENALEDESVLGRTLRPVTQALVTAWLGAGNERVYKGTGGWLFYRS
ncbi:MAG TPA: hypothetical protein VNK41_06565, partial [Vicinamibacterales bacterium]|nr:hypothetical protein [Vicinamibacterales bacterium]